MKRYLYITLAIALLSIAANIYLVSVWTPNITIEGKDGYQVKLSKLLDEQCLIRDARGNVTNITSLRVVLKTALQE